eukprot:m.30336 g.30336  ORF g.30336 m.30336 type:complete len:360 (+) comp4695_c0_seq1:81-1160(+)
MSRQEIVNRILLFRDTLARAITFDSWGQVLEAEVEYMKLVKLIQDSFSNVKLPFAEHQMKFLNKLAAACQARARDAQDLSGEREIPLSQMQKLTPMVEYLHAETPPFPFEIQGLVRDLQSIIAARKNLQASGAGKDVQDNNLSPTNIVSPPDEDGDDDDGDEDQDDGADIPGPSGAAPAAASGSGKGAGAGVSATLLPKKHFPSHTGITIRVERIALKDPEQYIEPFVTVRLCDPQGKAVRMGEPQDTPPGRVVSEGVAFNQDVHLQIPYEQISHWDLAVFLEFMYYKPKSKKKDKMKCLCWCMLEADELLANKQLPLEIYSKKPVYNIRHTQNYKKLTLHGSPGHFMYVTVIRHEPET